MKSLARFITFLLKHIVLICLVVGLCVAGFTISMNMSNMYVILNDGLQARANLILGYGDANEMSQYFTNYFINNDNYKTTQALYSQYDINSYGYNLKIDSLFTWPWQTRAEIRVHEAVYSIDGEIYSSVMSREEALLSGKLNPPAWKNASYKVTLIKESGRWVIDSLTYLDDYTYAAPTMRSIEPELLASLRPTPTPTPTLNPSATATAPPTAAPTQEPMAAHIVLNDENGTMNVRSGPGTNYESIGKLSNGDSVLIYEINGNWYRIKYNGQDAYIFGSYVAFDDMVD